MEVFTEKSTDPINIVHLGLKIGLGHLLFISLSTRLPAAWGGVNVENLVKGELALFENQSI